MIEGIVIITIGHIHEVVRYLDHALAIRSVTTSQNDQNKIPVHVVYLSLLVKGDFSELRRVTPECRRNATAECDSHNLYTYLTNSTIIHKKIEC